MPAITKDKIDSAMKDFADGAKEVYGDKLKEVILYGSCARGDFDDESDLDVMILLDVPPEKVRFEKKKLHPIIHKLDDKYGYDLLFATVIKGYEDFNHWLSVKPFYMNVRKDGIRYV